MSLLTNQRKGATFSRKEFFDLIWSTPLTKIGETFGVSDKAIAKVCLAHGMPMPGRGYWAMTEEQQTKLRPSLPLRPPGAYESIDVCGGAKRRTGTVRPQPTYFETVEEMRHRLAEKVGKLPNVHSSTNFTALIQKYITEDIRRDKANAGKHFVWPASDGPFFRSPLGVRKLTILNWLQTNAPNVGAKLSVRGKSAQNVDLTVGKITIKLSFEERDFTHGGFFKADDEELKKPLPNVMKLTALHEHWEIVPRKSWSDGSKPIETELPGILLAILIMAEETLRAVQNFLYKQELETAAHLREQERLRKIEAVRAASRAQKDREKRKIERMIELARQYRSAEDIRHFVSAIVDKSGAVNEFERWCSWARAEADRIDPLKNGALLEDVEHFEKANSISQG